MKIFDKFVFVKQPETTIHGELCSLGTGAAVRSCLSYFQEYNVTPQTKFIILSGDVPFIHLDELHSSIGDIQWPGLPLCQGHALWMAGWLIITSDFV